MPIDYTKREQQPAAAPPAPPPSSAQPPASGGAGGTVSLTKDRPTVSLSKRGGASGQMRVNLNWQSGKGGGLFRKSQSIDLDLACLWELADGRKGVVQALGNAFGSLQAPPYVMLDGDDRSGTATGGENLIVNIDHLDQIRRILVFAFIYEGAPAWDRADAVVTMFPVGAAPIEIRLDESSGMRTVALAMLENDGGQLTVRREIRYIDGSQAELDRQYGWGMNWKAGRK